MLRAKRDRKTGIFRCLLGGQKGHPKRAPKDAKNRPKNGSKNGPIFRWFLSGFWAELETGFWVASRPKRPLKTAIFGLQNAQSAKTLFSGKARKRGSKPTPKTGPKNRSKTTHFDAKPAGFEKWLYRVLYGTAWAAQHGRFGPFFARRWDAKRTILTAKSGPILGRVLTLFWPRREKRLFRPFGRRGTRPKMGTFSAHFERFLGRGNRPILLKSVEGGFGPEIRSVLGAFHGLLWRA